MDARTPTEEQLQQFNERGFYIARGLLSSEQTEAIRAALMRKAQAVANNGSYGGDRILEGVAQDAPDEIPLHERFRKLNGLDQIQELWDHWYAGEKVLEHLRGFLGDVILNKHASAFLKPAKIGGPTPWHQDIGLWGDRNEGAINAWLAIDPATKANGCLQVVPGSHKGPVIEHVTYEDSIHSELPRELVADVEVDHVELQPGDAVIWASKLWHYSPPNTSDQGRIGVGAVWVNPDQLSDLNSVNKLRWTMRDGERCAYPAPPFTDESSVAVSKQEGYV